MNTQPNQLLFSNSIRYLFFIFLFFFSLGQLQKITLPVGSLYIHDLVITITIIIAFFTRQFSLHQIYTNIIGSCKKHFFLTLCILFISTRTLVEGAITDNITPFLYISRLLMYALFNVFVCRTVKSKTVTMGWLISIFAVLYLGVLQFFFIPDIRFLAILGWDDHYYRLVSTLLDPAFTGLFFVFGIITVLQNESFKKYKAILLTFLSIGLTLTYSRSSWLALMGVLAYIGFKNLYEKKSIKTFFYHVFFILAIMITTFFLAPKPGGEGVNLTRTASINARITNATSNVSESTLLTFFIGDGLFSKMTPTTLIPYRPQVPDNFFVLLFKGGGIFSLVFGTIGLIKIVYTNGFARPIANSLLIGLLIHTLFSASIIQPFVFLLFLGLYDTQKYTTLGKLKG